MSLPLSGFPDYQQYASWRGQTLIDQNVSLGAGAQTVFGPYAMGNYASLRFAIDGNANGITVQVTGMSSPTDPAPALVESWILRNFTNVYATVPVTFSYVKIIVASEPLFAANIRLRVQPTNIMPVGTQYWGISTYLALGPRVINNGAQDIWYPSDLVPGPAHIWIFGNASPLPLFFGIIPYDVQGNVLPDINSWRSMTVDFHDNFQIPPMAWRLHVANNSGVAQTYYFGITSNPKGS